MAYGPESHDGYPSYEAVVVHPVSGVKARVTVSPSWGDQALPEDAATAEAHRDALFQAILSEFVASGALTIESATKRGGYTADVTP